MCGVAGIFAYHYAAPPVDRDELAAIRDHMAARGPDGKGEWYSHDSRVALGHRRLAIIDLSDRAAQPMVSRDGRLAISFNGEIYNYRELRARLEKKGKSFRTESDTEVVLHLYEEIGEGIFNELRGMFAFALWDARKAAMLLARDPYGIKPLYFADDGWSCRFASQVKALLTSKRVSRTPEPAGLAGFYLFGSVPEPWTLYQEIRSVPAGSYQWVRDTGPDAPVTYFSVAKVWRRAANEPTPAESELQPLVREAVLDSVRAHNVADVPVGAFLSAGIDSGALVGLMSELPRDRTRLETITLSFEEFRGTNADETPLAEQVARRYGAGQTSRVVSEDEFRADLPRILEAMDQPSIDGINTWFVSKAASEAGLKVAVSGVGGDELFGGYPSFVDIPRWTRRLRSPAHVPGLGWLSEQLIAAFAPLMPKVNPKAAGILRYGGSWPGAYLLRRGLFLPRELPAIVGEDAARCGLRRLRPLRHIRRQLDNPDDDNATLGDFAKASTLESSLYLRNQLLRDADWAGMAHSLEIRTPLVDARLLQKLAGPLIAAGAGNHKHLLARSPSAALPGEVVDRAKSGFTTPIADWQRHGDIESGWKRLPILSRVNCPWARRWGFTVACEW